MKQRNILISVPSYYNSVYLPYIWGLLRAEADKDETLQQSYNWLKPIYEFGTPEHLLSEYAAEKIDVLGLSCYDWNWEIQTELARIVRKKNPNCLIVMGGPEVPFKSPTFFVNHPEIDIVVKQDGEITFTKILSALQKNSNDYSKISGLVIRTSSGVEDTGPPEKPNLKQSLSPYLQYPEFKAWAAEGRENSRIKAFWETNRGCPYQCSFCDWGSNTYTKVRMVDRERLIEETKWFGENKIDTIFISDANFGMFRQDLETTNLLGKSKLETGYPREVHWLPAKNNVDRVFQISKEMHQFGFLHALIIGFQSTDDSVLQLMNRKNISNERFVELTNRCKENKIPVVGVLIMGCPGETHGSFCDSLHDLIEIGFHSEIRTHMYSVLPNAPAAEPEYMEANEIECIERPMVQQRCFQKDAQMPFAGRSKFIVGHTHLSKEEWKESFLYASMIFVFHNFGLTRFLARFSREFGGQTYGNFYQSLYQFIRSNNSTIGQLFKEIEKVLSQFLENPNATVLFDLGIDDKLYEAEEFLLYHCLKNFEATYFELDTYWNEYIQENLHLPIEVCEDLFDFQKNMIIKYDYTPDIGMSFTQRVNWIEKFSSSEKSEAIRMEDSALWEFRGNGTETGVGITRQPLTWKNFNTYFKRVVGHRYYRFDNLFLQDFQVEKSFAPNPRKIQDEQPNSLSL